MGGPENVAIRITTYANSLLITLTLSIYLLINYFNFCLRNAKLRNTATPPLPPFAVPKKLSTLTISDTFPKSFQTIKR